MQRRFTASSAGPETGFEETHCHSAHSQNRILAGTTSGLPVSTSVIRPKTWSGQHYDCNLICFRPQGIQSVVGLRSEAGGKSLSVMHRSERGKQKSAAMGAISLIVLAICSQLFAQHPPVQEPTDLKVELRSATGSNRFQLGEVIPLEVLISSSTANRYLEPCKMFWESCFGYPQCRFVTLWAFDVFPGNGWTDIGWHGCRMMSGPSARALQAATPCSMTVFFHSSPAGTISSASSAVLLTELCFTAESGELLIWLVSSSRPTVIDNRTVYFPGASKRNLLVSV